MNKKTLDAIDARILKAIENERERQRQLEQAKKTEAAFLDKLAREPKYVVLSHSSGRPSLLFGSTGAQGESRVFFDLPSASTFAAGNNGTIYELGRSFVPVVGVQPKE